MPFVVPTSTRSAANSDELPIERPVFVAANRPRDRRCTRTYRYVVLFLRYGLPMHTGSAPAARRPAQPRQSQQQRTDRMRQRILASTVACLEEYGYAGTTITRVVEHAGITRGALAHHFATKADMVVTAVAHIAAARTTELIAKGHQARGTDDPVGSGLDLMWTVHQGPMFVAVAELWVAARADRELQRRVTFLEQATNAVIMELAKALYGSFGADPEVRNLIYTAMDVVRGILLSGMARVASAEETEARWQRAKAHLRLLFEHALTQQPTSAQHTGR